MDTSSEEEQWSPHIPGAELSILQPGQYPYHLSHAASCFESSCKLAVILNDIIGLLYERSKPAYADPSAIQSKLDLWRQSTASHLLIDVKSPPASCPPPHILTQKYASSPKSQADQIAFYITRP